MRAAFVVALLAIVLVAAHAEEQHADAHAKEAASIEDEAKRLIGMIQVHVADQPEYVYEADTTQLDAIRAMRERVAAVRAKVAAFNSQFEGVGDHLLSYRERLQSTLEALNEAHARQMAHVAAWEAAQRTAALRPRQSNVVVPVNVETPPATVVVVKPTPKFRFAMPRHSDAMSFHDLAESTADVETASYAAEMRLKAAAHERDVTRAAMQADSELRQLQSQAALQETAALTQFQQQALVSQARLEKTSAQAIERVEEALAVKAKNEKMAGVIRAQIMAMKPPKVTVIKQVQKGFDVDAAKVQAQITDQLRSALKKAQTVSKVQQAKAIKNAVIIQSIALKKQALATKKLENMLKTANAAKKAAVAKARAQQQAVTNALRKELNAVARATKPVPVWVRELSMVKDLKKVKSVPPTIKQQMAAAKKSLQQQLSSKSSAAKQSVAKKVAVLKAKAKAVAAKMAAAQKAVANQPASVKKAVAQKFAAAKNSLARKITAAKKSAKKLARKAKKAIRLLEVESEIESEEEINDEEDEE